MRRALRCMLPLGRIYSTNEIVRPNRISCTLPLEDRRPSVAMISARLPALRHQAIVSLVMGGVALWAAYIVSGWINTEQDRMLIFLGGGIALITLGYFILRNWRSGFYLFLGWLIFEDLIRKYLGNNMVIYFAKDVLVALICISLYLGWRRRKEKLFRPPFIMFLGIFFWYSFLQVFNVYSPSLLYGILGMKLYFYYIPLMFVGYALIRTENDLRRFLNANLVLASLVAMLGIVQAVIGPKFLNPSNLDANIRGLSSLERSAPLTGEIVSIPTAVFVSAGRYGWYLELATILSLATAGYFLLTGKRGRTMALATIGLIVVAILLSGSRGALVFSGISALGISAGFLWGANLKTGQIQRLFKGFRRSAIIVGAIVLLAFIVVPKSLSSRWAFYSETLSPNSSRSEITLRSWDYPIQNLLAAFSEPHWLMGNGVGTASLGVQYVSALLGGSPPPINVENGFGTLLVEMGILGPFLWILWASALVVSCWRVVRRLKGTRLLPVGFAICWLAFLVLFPFTYGGMPAYQNYVLNAYLWLLIGILFKLPSLLNASPIPANPTRLSLRSQRMLAR